MFLPRIFMICTLSLGTEAQNYYRTGGYSRLSHAQPAQDYSRPAPFVHHELPQHQQYQPAARQHQQAPGGDKSQCRLDYVERSGEVCVPTFTTDCDKEDLNSGLIIRHKEECYSVTKTVCTERTDIEDMEVCATRLTMISQEAEARVVSAVWREECEEERTCLPGPGYHCAESVRHVCSQTPALVPVTRTVSLKLPQPVQTCIIKQVLLPRIQCQQVKERRCVMAASTEARAEGGDA